MTTPNGFSSAAKPIVAIWLLSPHSPKKVMENAYSTQINGHVNIKKKLEAPYSPFLPYDQ
jgi:hypothetical protein